MSTPNTQSDLTNSADSSIKKAETQNTNTETNSTPSKVAATVVKKNNSPLIIGGVVGTLLLTAIIAGVSMNGSKPVDTALARNDKSSSNSAKTNTTISNSGKTDSKSEIKNNNSVQNNANLVNPATNPNGNNTNTNTNNSNISNNTNPANPTPNSGNTTNTNQTTNPVTNSTVANQSQNAQNNAQTPSQNPSQTPSQANTNTNSGNLPVNSAQEADNKPKPLSESENKVKDERSTIDRFLEVKASNDKINLNPLTMTKEEAKIVKGDDKVSLEVKPDPEKKSQKFRYTLDYASAGDMDFEKATLTITLDKALKIIPGSIKDNFDGQSLSMPDSLFVGNVAKYGPGSKDKEFSSIKVGQKGTITIDIEIPAETPKGEYRVASVLTDLITEQNQMPSLYFFEVKE